MYCIFNCKEWQCYVTENFAHLYDYVVESDSVLLTGMTKLKKELMFSFVHTLFSKDNILAGIEYSQIVRTQNVYNLVFNKTSMVNFIKMFDDNDKVFIHKIIIKEKAEKLTIILNEYADKHILDSICASKQVSERQFLIDKFLKQDV